MGCKHVIHSSTTDAIQESCIAAALSLSPSYAELPTYSTIVLYRVHIWLRAVFKCATLIDGGGCDTSTGNVTRHTRQANDGDRGLFSFIADESRPRIDLVYHDLKT